MDIEDKAAAIYKQIKNFDPLAKAEELVGAENKESVRGLGLILTMVHSQNKKDLLKAMNDTHFNSSFSEALEALITLGFSIVYEEKFKGSDNYNETFLILWNPMGLLARLESYSETHMNMISVQGNWHCENKMDYYKFHNSGDAIFEKPRDFDSKVLGYTFEFDGREGLKHHISEMATVGSFLPYWLELGHIWFLNYQESRELDKNYDKVPIINKMKFDKLPQHVKDAMVSKNIVSNNRYNFGE